MPPKHNRRQNANSRDKRHDNGLAAPGKQIKKRKSNGHINGTAGKDVPAQSAASGAHLLNTHTPSLPTRALEQTRDGHSANTQSITPSAITLQGVEHDSSSASEADVKSKHVANGFLNSEVKDESAPELSHPPLDKAGVAMSNGPTTTVIGTHSLGDVIAIILLLLQLPTSMLVVVQLCFAILTFSVPSGSWSPFSLFNNPEWFPARAGSPTIWTTIGMDALVFAVWPFIGKQKNFILDYAQAVIAISLGGGANGRGRLHSVACMIIITAGHLYHFESIRQRCLDTVWDTMSSFKYIPWPMLNVSFTPAGSSIATRTFPRALLELHIIVQGVVRVVRRALRPLEVKHVNKKHLHGEAAVCLSSTSISATADRAGDGGRNPSTDGRPPGPPPLTHEAKDKCVSGGKKRRKQATLVRSLQPFWAAIANTKVTVSKEIEHSQVSRDAFEANAADANHLGNAMDRCSEDRVWVTDITDTEIFFSVITNQDDERLPSPDDGGRSHETLSLRVNGASWTSTWTPREGSSDGRHIACGKIFGLTPSTSYFVQFFSSNGCKLLHTASLLTRPIANSDAGNTLAAPPQALRPSSPTTTLKSSIIATDARLQDHRNQLKKNRRDHRNANTMLKKDVDSLESRLSSFGGNDDRQRQRRFQYLQNIRQAHDTASELASRLEDLGEIPEIERFQLAESRSRWESATSKQSRLHEDVNAAKSRRNQQIATARAETGSLQQKRERLLARLNKLNLQRDQLAAINAQSHEHQTLLHNERTGTLSQRQATEQNYLSNIQRMESERRELENLSMAYEQQMQALEMNVASPFGAGPSALPQTPEHVFANMASAARHQSAFSNSVTFQDPVGTPPPAQSRRSSNLQKGNGPVVRGRSSSMLSNVSAFTDAETGNSPTNGVHLPLGEPVSSNGSMQGRNRSEGSGSSFTPGAGRANQSSPIPRLSPIGTEVGRGSPRNTKS